jgi:hypothetical protein
VFFFERTKPNKTQREKEQETEKERSKIPGQH